MAGAMPSPHASYRAIAASAATEGLGPRVPIEAVPMTYREYLALPEGVGYALLDGLCFREPMPTVHHQIIADNIAELLRHHARSTRAGLAVGAIDIHLDARNCPAPDVCFISAARRNRLDHRGLHGIAPDLCVEVLSPSTASRDRTQKAQLYARYGCREYWLVDPDRLTVEVLRVGGDGAFVPAGVYAPGEVFESVAVAGLCVQVREVFAADAGADL